MDSVKLVVFDWAGTLIDFGSLAPVSAFIRTFAAHGIEVSADEAKGPMGLHKKDHLLAMLQMPAISKRWQAVHGRDWHEQDLQSMYDRFMPLQLEVHEQHSRLVPGAASLVSELRRQGIKVGAATGYFQEAANRVYASARQQGLVPDCCVCVDEVPAGRPAPWMIFRIMEKLGIYPTRAVVKVGDTVPDIAEGLNAGAFSVGVIDASSEIGLTQEQLAALPPRERSDRFATTRAKFLAAGANAVIDTLAELPKVLARLAAK